MKIDFSKGVYVQVGGELGKHNSLPIDNFIQFAHDLQNIVLNIAKHDLPSDQSIDLDNFRLEITDFKKGSAVPQFAFTHRFQETLGETLSIHRERVNERFKELMIIADEGNYSKLKLLYHEPAKRAIIVENLYSLSNNFGNSPVSFAEYSLESNQFVPIFKLKRFRAETKRELLADVIPDSNLLAEENTAYAKVKLKNDKKGKPRRTITQLYTQKRISLNFAPEMINVSGKQYFLKFPLRCHFEKEDDYYVIQSEMLDIIGTGITEDEAEQSFSQEFDFLFNRLNELDDDQLSGKLRMVKSFINQMIDKIEHL